MSPDDPLADSALESLLATLVPNCDGLNRESTLYRAGHAAATAEARGRLRRWRAASLAATAVAAHLAFAPVRDEPMQIATASPVPPVVGPSRAHEPQFPPLAVEAVSRDSGLHRATGARILSAGMSLWEIRQVLAHEEEPWNDSPTFSPDSQEPLTPRSFDRIFEDRESPRNSPS